MNWTVPVVEVGVTDAVRVTVCPKVALGALEVTDVVVTAFTVWARMDELVAMYELSPL
jgi:hypothetical protein